MTTTSTRSLRAWLAAGALALALPAGALGQEGPREVGRPAERPPVAPVPTPEAVERALADALADPALQDGRTRAHLEGAGVGDVLTTGTKHLYAAFQAWMKGLYYDHPLLYLAIILGLILVAIPLVSHITWSLSLAFRRVAPRARGAGAGDDPAARRRRSAELRAEARAHADAGRLRDAARALLLAFLALLDERHALAVAGSWTNREVLARLRVPPPVRARLARFVDAADAACYGQQGPTPAALAEGEALLLELERGADLPS